MCCYVARVVCVVSVCLFFFFFFFSSRRRHTRSLCDWSSDVCSSDLSSSCRTGSWVRCCGARVGGARSRRGACPPTRSEEHTSELQSHSDLVCRLLLEKKKITKIKQQRPEYPSRPAENISLLM